MSGPRPNFFIVGAMKAGTTSMHNYLAQHPQVFMSRLKEPRHLAPDLDSGSTADGNWFMRSRSEYLALFAEAGGARVVGESSHVYLHSEEAAGRIRALAPDARILIMLRDPVEMIYARFQQSVLSLRENITSFEEALEAERDRLNGQRLPPGAFYLRGYQYREACVLAPQVRRYLDTFGRDRVLVITLEDLAERPLEVYRQVLEFLGVDPDYVPPDMAVHNPRRAARSERLHRWMVRRALVGPRSRRGRRSPVTRLGTLPFRLIDRVNRRRARRVPMPRQLEERLTLEFAPDVRELSELLDRDLGARWPRFAGSVQRPAATADSQAPAAEPGLGA